MIDEKFLNIMTSIINYYINADPKTTEMVKTTGNLVLKRIDDLFNEKKFFEEWRVYEKDTPTSFTDDETKIIYLLIKKVEEDYLNKDVDIQSILDIEDINYVKNINFQENLAAKAS